MVGSANLNIMLKAARKAGRSLVKDFREVENLQVSMKGAGDFVSKADISAEAANRIRNTDLIIVPLRSSSSVISSQPKLSKIGQNWIMHC